MKLLLVLFFISSCSSTVFRGEPREGKTTYSYADVSGSFRLIRESKKVKSHIVTRNQILSSTGSGLKVLEKSVLVSQLGSIQSEKARLLTVRPVASEFTVWLEGKRYSSQMKLIEKTKSLRVTLESPEPKWQGQKEISFPKGKYFCFFNQIPECLYRNYLLIKAYEMARTKFDFYIIWDNYPFVQDQLTGIGQNPFSAASVKFEGENKGRYSYSIETEGQMINYHFSKSFDLLKISWISQGITVVPPGEEVADDE